MTSFTGYWLTPANPSVRRLADRVPRIFFSLGHPTPIRAKAQDGLMASCARVRTRRYSLPNSDNPSLHPSIMNQMKNQTVPMIVAIMENILALLECS
jgi:hypothetical protein